MTAADLVSLLRFRAAAQPDAVAYIFDDGVGVQRPVSYAWLDERARAIAAAIAARGIAARERALLMFAPGPDYVAGFFGCLYAGVVAVPVYPPEDARGLERISAVWEDCTPSAILSTSDIAAIATEWTGGQRLPWLATDTAPDEDAIDWRQPSIAATDLAFLQYTSGSTATPKGVMVTHANLIHNSSVICRALGLGPHSRGMSWLPPYHDMGLIGGILQPLYGGFPCVLMSPVAFLRDPVRWLSAISRHRATISAAPDFAYAECVRRIAPEQCAELDLSTWEHALVGAEPVRPSTLLAFTEAFGEFGFSHSAWYPCYGLAEATLFVTGGEPRRPPSIVDVGGQALTGCGHAWDPDAVAIVDPATGVPDATGEIWVSGPTVAAGYWGTRDQSVFGRTMPGDTRRWLRTGDLGFLRDGHLYVTGRIKDVLIVRGRNHHPQDIELTAEGAHRLLRPHRGAAFAVDDTVVLVHEVTREFRAEDAEVVSKAIRSAVLAGHGISLHEVVLVRGGAIPRTSSGKIRRAACRSNYLGGSLRLAAPPDATPTRLSLVDGPFGRIVARVLRVDPKRLFADDTLVGLGLDSVSAIALQMALLDELGFEAGLELLLGPTPLAQLAGAIAGIVVAAPVPSPTSGAHVRSSGDGPPVASFGQERLWLLHQADPGSDAYNVGAAIDLRGALDVAALIAGLREVQGRHEALRTTVVLDDEGVLRQRIHSEATIVAAVRDLSKLPTAERETTAARIAADLVSSPFDLAASPPVRAAVLRLSDVDHRLVVAAHHVAVDAASLEVVLYDLIAAYRSVAVAEAPQYAAWANAERRRMAGPRFEADLAYWRDKLTGAQPLRLLGPTPGPGAAGAGPAPRAHRVAVELPAPLAMRLREFARGTGSTPFMVLVAAFAAVLGRWSGLPEVTVATPLSGRDRPQAARVVGFVANTVALRVRVPAGTVVRELLEQVRATCLEAYAHGAVPFEKVIETVRPDRSTGLAPLAQAMLAMRRLPGRSEFGGDLTGEAHEIPSADTQFDVAMHLTEGVPDGGIVGCAWARADLLSEDDLQRLTEGFRILLSGMLGDPAERVDRLPIQPAEHATWIADELSRGTVTAPSELCLHQLVEQQADATPDAVAVAFEGTALSYADLDRRANRLAHRLLALGVRAETLVGVCVPRSIEMVVALLAVLKAGAAYVPLDPDYPPARLGFMISDIGADVVLASSQTIAAGLFDGTTASVVNVGDAGDWPSERPCVPVAPDNLAYVIYTSGSTGVPKGVMNAHRGVVNRILWGQRHFELGPDESLLQKTPLGFDVSGWELYWPLLVGARLVLARPGGHRDPEYLSSVIRGERITTVQFVPSMLDAFLAQPSASECADTLRRVVCSGEALSPTLVGAFHAHLPGVRLFNLYGPTEAAIEVTALECLPGTSRVTIGHPIDNARVHVLNPFAQPTPIGVPGELHIGGAPVARGYWRRPGLTAQRFVPDPFGHGTRLYRTGDLARVCPDGAIDYLGRLDQQVKIRGVRVELGEVEVALCQHPGIRSAAVDIRPAVNGGPRLVGYLVCDGPPPSLAEVRKHMAQLVPQAMIPATYVVVPDLPVNPSGKLDRAALPAPRDGGASAGYLAPANGIEEILAEIWAQVLGVDRVGVQDDFFDLGGHSLLATKVLARVRAAFGVEPPLAELLAGRLTVRGMAELVAAGQLAGANADDVLALIAQIEEASR